MADEQKEKLQGLIALPADDARRIAAERERRRYVKRNGGLCKGMPQSDVGKATELCKTYGLPADNGWDKDIDIPGMSADYVN